MSTEGDGAMMFASLQAIAVESVEVQQSSEGIVYLYVFIEGVDGKLSLVLTQEQALDLCDEVNMAAKYRESPPTPEDSQQ
jgi:chemotaxis protein CheY-P-specific phosphatase CheC